VTAKLRTVSIVGARPQFVKVSPVSRAMKSSPLCIEDRIVHTGQHYDDSMSKIFFAELDIPRPDANLGIGSGSQGYQTGRMLEAIETYLHADPPDAVIVYGDTNSTLAGALAAAKMHIPVAHVEAGLRSFNRRMPEELNRIAADHLSDMLFAPTATAMRNLATEGLAVRSALTGDVMYDAVLFNAQVAADRSRILDKLGLAPREFGIATIHRAENTTVDELAKLLDALNRATETFGRIVFPAHPRTLSVLRRELSGWRPSARVMIIEPVGYLDMLALLQHAKWILTDSGGLQKEAFFLGCPCVTLRDETEWVETLEEGANVIAGADGAGLERSLTAIEGRPRSPTPAARRDGPFGAGDAAERIVEALRAFGGGSR
jgi:UDP-N-acetylglucosamine 2-epimerase